jgi:hypothetical protein
MALSASDTLQTKFLSTPLNQIEGYKYRLGSPDGLDSLSILSLVSMSLEMGMESRILVSDDGLVLDFVSVEHASDGNCTFRLVCVSAKRAFTDSKCEDCIFTAKALLREGKSVSWQAFDVSNADRKRYSDFVSRYGGTATEESGDVSYHIGKLL